MAKLGDRSPQVVTIVSLYGIGIDARFSLTSMRVGTSAQSLVLLCKTHKASCRSGREMIRGANSLGPVEELMSIASMRAICCCYTLLNNSIERRLLAFRSFSLWAVNSGSFHLEGTSCLLVGGEFGQLPLGRQKSCLEGWIMAPCGRDVLMRHRRGWLLKVTTNSSSMCQFIPIQCEAEEDGLRRVTHSSVAVGISPARRL